MSTEDRTPDYPRVLAHYRAVRLEAKYRTAWVPEPLEVVTKRIRAMVQEYLNGYPRRMGGRW